MKLEWISAFIAIAECGSISEASVRTGVSKSALSERLADLERSFATRLVQRTTRRMQLTEDGLTFLERARAIERELTLAHSEFSERRGELVGPLRLSAPVSFGYLHLGPALYPFLKEHPRIELTLDLDDRFVDVEAGGYDAVIRHASIKESWLVAIKLATSRRILVASPEYLAQHGMPITLKELEGHNSILYTNRVADWRFETSTGKISVVSKTVMRVNNGLVMRDAARAGLGIALLPSFFVHEDLTAGSLIALDIGIEPEGADIHLAYSKSVQPSAKIRALTAHLKSAFRNPPYWEAVHGQTSTAFA
jgi:DNA-binding transcriptional LysR family regulator